MITKQTSELTGPALDWAVAKCEGTLWLWENLQKPCPGNAYSTDPALADPIIDREKIEVRNGNPLYFPNGNENGYYYEPLFLAGRQHGQTRFIAAMRHHVASKLGSTIEIPEELL